jgi:CHAT domain-containing protein
LTNVPFSILLDDQTGRYLIEDHTISFTPALWVLGQCNERFKSMAQASKRVEPSVALGDPAYRRVKTRLVHTLDEVTKISECFKDGCVKVITGPEASIDNLLNFANLPVDTVQGFVHIAAHGLVNQENRSGSLLLANSKIKYKDPQPMKFNTHSGTQSH